MNADPERCPCTVHSTYVTDHRCQRVYGHPGDCLFGAASSVSAGAGQQTDHSGPGPDDPLRCRHGYLVEGDNLARKCYEDGVPRIVPPAAGAGQVPADTIEKAHTVQRDVEDFHRALDIPVGSYPAIRRPELRAALIEEEARETVDAIGAGDLVGAIDGLCDLLCVTYGAAAEFGVDLAPFWDEVHRSNMAKRRGPVRADGKRLKPEGWTPPDIAGILDAALAAVRTPEEKAT